MGTKQFAFVVVGDTVQRKDVTIGQTNERMIEIVAGMVEGDQIVMNPRTHFKKEIEELEAEQASQQSKVDDENQPKPAKTQDKLPPTGSTPGSPPANGDKPVAANPAREGRAPGQPSEGGRPAFDPVARFKALDQNGDGKVTKDEADERMLSRFDTFDGDGDGAISQAEWTSAMAKFRSSGGGGSRPPTGDAGGGGL